MSKIISRTLAFAWLLWLPSLIESADFQPATARVKDRAYWVGQRVPFMVELRAAGSFSGAASFSLPKVPRVIIIKLGNPVVSSENNDGESVFVQTHEFALFSQQSGTVQIPSFGVRFSHRDGFTGPVQVESAQVPATEVEIKRPEGSNEDEFLVTTSSLNITESWDPQPGSTEQAAVFHRTITQEANQISGMALAPPPDAVPDGVRMYADHPDVADHTERGELSGSRTDRITYVMQQSGTWTLPGIQYVWWESDKEQFVSKTLPAVTFDVAAPPGTVTATETEAADRSILGWVAAVLLVMSIAYGLRRTITSWLQGFWHHWNPPDRLAARKLLRACRQNDPVDAEKAWIQWQESVPAGVELGPALRAAAVEMQRTLFGSSSDHTWQGEQLATAFRQQLTLIEKGMNHRKSALPLLNS